MTAREKQMLENVLNTLDRLFDRQSSAIDVWAVLLATSEALRATPHHVEFEEPTAGLLAVVRSGGTAEVQRDRALVATDTLRHYLARLLPLE